MEKTYLALMADLVIMTFAERVSRGAAEQKIGELDLGLSLIPDGIEESFFFRARVPPNLDIKDILPEDGDSIRIEPELLEMLGPAPIAPPLDSETTPSSQWPWQEQDPKSLSGATSILPAEKLIPPASGKDVPTPKFASRISTWVFAWSQNCGPVPPGECAANPARPAQR
ncbi:MAG: hypothetical protein MI919_27240, partial [Holophagales bacterium]|nr:hypothetical protein [Holophagales bacterium]